jgi:hypothetical protein
MSLWCVWRKSCTYLASRLAWSPNIPKGASSWPSSPRSTIGCVQKDFLSLWYICHKPYTYLAPTQTFSPSDHNEIHHDRRHLGFPSGASKMIFEPMVRPAQSVHLSCVKITTISKRTETRFHLSLKTLEYHQVSPKWFLGLWYVWRKPCTYLELTLILSPNRPKRDSTWPMSPRCSIRCVQNNFEPMVRSAQTMHLSSIKINTISNQTETSYDLSLVTYEYNWLRPKRFLSLWCVWRKSCIYLASRLA